MPSPHPKQSENLSKRILFLTIEGKKSPGFVAGLFNWFLKLIT